MQTFDCGSAQYERDVARWIKNWVWNPRSEPGLEVVETIVAFDRDADNLLAGYGSWGFAEVPGRQRHLAIAWFGVDRRYQGLCDANGASVAGTIYATTEAAARAHEEAEDGMPFTLVCHEDNERGRRFWEGRGYRLINDADAQIIDGVYHRFVR